MSGTSLDGIDAALIASDGLGHVEAGPAMTIPYPDDFRERLRAILGRDDPAPEVEAELTELHAEIVAVFRRRHPEAEFDLIGFHGHTVRHRPAERRTRQLGDGALLARRTGTDVVADFRSTDVAAGGEGAPLAPLYHAALAAGLEKPLAILNLGGVGNLTWLGPGDGDILAFDTGPGNALIDDWARRHTGRAADFGGTLAAGGRVAMPAVMRFLAAPYFARKPPKSLDREEFRQFVPNRLGAADGAATLTEMSAAAVAAARRHFPAAAREFLVCGGGRHNPVLMAALARLLGVPVRPVEEAGWNGDALEAQAFAYLAIRSVAGLPLSLPTTTGVKQPLTGGRLFRATAP